MMLSDFATFSTALSGFAVTASLIYLAMQTHQNAKHTRALINQGRVALIAELSLSRTNAGVAEAFLISTTGKATPEAVKQLQFVSWATAAMYGWQDSFSQHERGLLDEDIYMAMQQALNRAFIQPSFREAYETSFKVPGTKFASFVDNVIAKLPAAETRNPL